MIKANDFRIGNKVIQGKRLCEIASISGIKYSFGQQDVDLYFYDSKKIERHSVSSLKLIETTEEWLLKAGFKKSPANNSFFISIPKIKSEIHFEYFRGALVCVIYCSTGSFIPNDIKYIHQLQNLCFIIVGEELVFSTEP